MGDQQVAVVPNRTYDLLSLADAALVTSGTATLETALFKVPEVVCYAGPWASFLLAKWLVGNRLKFISLVNLIMDREVVRELIQSDLTPKKRWLIIDDLIATGGTLKAVAGMVEHQGAEVAGIFSIIGLPFLNYMEKIKDYNPVTLIDYEGE